MHTALCTIGTLDPNTRTRTKRLLSNCVSAMLWWTMEQSACTKHPPSSTLVMRPPALVSTKTKRSTETNYSTSSAAQTLRAPPRSVHHHTWLRVASSQAAATKMPRLCVARLQVVAPLDTIGSPVSGVVDVGMRHGSMTNRGRTGRAKRQTAAQNLIMTVSETSFYIPAAAALQKQPSILYTSKVSGGFGSWTTIANY
jgi:hypothetical protein